MAFIKRGCCENCGENLIAGANFCSKCGAKVQQEKKCLSCGTVLSMDERFCHMCGKKYIGTEVDENTPIMQSSEVTKISDDEKRKQILRKLESFNCTILKDVGDGFYLVLTRETYNSYETLRLCDLRDVSDINLDIGEFEFGFENELYAHNVFSTRGDMWIGKVKDGKIFFVVKKRALYNEQWTLYRIDLAEIDKIGCVDYSPEEMEVNQSIPEVVKLQDGSIRIVYDRGYVKQTIVFDIEGKIDETLSREFETGYVTNAQILDNTDELIFFHAN